MRRQDSWNSRLVADYRSLQDNLQILLFPLFRRTGKRRLHVIRAGKKCNRRLGSPVAEFAREDGRLAGGGIENTRNDDEVLLSGTRRRIETPACAGRILAIPNETERAFPTEREANLRKEQARPLIIESTKENC